MKKSLLTFTLAALTSLAAFAYPDNKPVTMVVPFPPGGSTDAIARVLAQKLPEKLGGTWVIENKAGATGTLGAAFVKRAPADGHTLFVSSLGPFVIAPHLIKGVQYDALKDFDPITVAVQAPNVLAVPASSPHKSLQDVIAYEKAHPSKMTFASAGNGTSDHLTAELFWQQTGTTGLHVPYKGGAPAISDLLGAQVDASFQNVNAVFPHIKAGKLKALAVTTLQRSPFLPETPPVADTLKGFSIDTWWGLVAPAGTPKATLDKLNQAFVAALGAPETKSRFAALFAEPVPTTPEQFGAFMKSELAKYEQVVKATGAKVD